MALVAPNPEYDKFNADWQKSHPFTLPPWTAPYSHPALDTDVSGGMAFGDWKKQLHDYISGQQAGWAARGTQPAMPAIQPPGQVSTPITPPDPMTNSAIPPTGMATPGSPQIAPKLGQNQIPMPDQLGAAAMQSPLFGDNWASMFNQQ